MKTLVVLLPFSFLFSAVLFAQAPTLTSVSPSIGTQGTSVPVTLTGTNFQTPASFLFNKSGITVSNTTVVSATQITATFTIAGTAALGAVSVVVATHGGASGAQTFTVNPPAPTLTSVSPASGVQGGSVPVTLTGTNFVSGATVSTTNGGITVGSVTVVSATQITATFTIGGSAALGTTNVTVTTSGGASGAQTFTVNPPAPTLTSVSPSSGAQGASIPVTLTGANFASGATVSTTNGGITVSNVTVGSSSQITALFAIGGNATLGAGNVVVTAGGVASNAVSFTVTPVPLITGLSPTSGAAGVQVTVSGSGFGSAQGTGAVWLGSTRGTVVSWSDTQIVATVASNSTSGTAQVQQGGVWSNPEPFAVNTATILNVAPTSGVPGTQVTITGSGFGAAQGSGQVWLGTLNGVVQSWSDTQVVALVATGSASGNVQVLQNGVMSPPWPFTVNTLQLGSVSPTSGLPGTSVTFTGAGFGSLQGSGIVWLGSTAGQVLSWSDTQVVAAVAPTALTGIARVQQNGAWSNSFGFTVPVSGGNTVVPAMLNMVVGDTHTIQALSPTGQSVTGLTWTSSAPTVVSLSTDDPPILTALAAGHVTVTAGTASADVTVSAVALALGTVIWSNPGDGSGVDRIVPAVPSASGVADVFAFQNDGTVQAITSDGITAWTADVSQALAYSEPVLPDFQGGLVVLSFGDSNNWTGSIVKFDGITGQPYPAYTPPAQTSDTSAYLWDGLVGVHTDGTIFAGETEGYGAGADWWQQDSVIGIDPTTGTQKFTVPVNYTSSGHPLAANLEFGAYSFIIAGDGYAYLPYTYNNHCDGDTPQITHFMLLRINSRGAYDKFEVMNWVADWPLCANQYLSVNTITNADQGILLTWELGYQPAPMLATAPHSLHRPSRGYRVSGTTPRFDDGLPPPTFGMALTTGASASVVSAPQVPGQTATVVPVLQAQDGSFVGYAEDGNTGNNDMVAFDATGNVRWMVPNDQPQIATADGGVIGQSGITYDQNGSATGQTTPTTQSWLGYAYQDGSVTQVRAKPVDFGLSFAALKGGSPSANGTDVKLVRNEIFLPAGIGSAAQNTTYLNQTQKNISSTNIAVDVLLNGQATLGKFKGALATTNTIVTYMAHGLELQMPNGQTTNAVGLCFGSNSNSCIVPQPLIMSTTGDGTPYQILPPAGMTWDVFPNGFAPKAKVVFVAACGVDANFIAQWHLQSSGQALIVPQYLPTNPGMIVNAYNAAWEWEGILLTLAQGQTVSAAVAVGNQSAATQGSGYVWQVIGDGNVSFQVSKH